MAGRSPEQILPVVTYTEEQPPTNFPWTLAVNRGRLGNFLTGELKITPEQIQRLAFLVDYSAAFAKSEMEVKPELTVVTQSLLTGDLSLDEESGNPVIALYTGSAVVRATTLGNECSNFYSLVRRSNLSPSLVDYLSGAEALIEEEFPGRGVADFLRTENPEDATEFVRSLVDEKFKAYIIETILINSIRAKAYEELTDLEECLKGRQRLIRRLLYPAGVGWITAFGSGILGIAHTIDFRAQIISFLVGFSLVSFSLVYTSIMKKQMEKLAATQEISSLEPDEYIKSIVNPQKIREMGDLLDVSPNPNFQDPQGGIVNFSRN